MITTRIVATLAAFALAGCAAPVDAKKESGPVKEAATSVDTKKPAAAKTTELAKQDDGVAAFGERFRYEDGLVVTVSKPAKFKPSRYAAGYKKGQVGVLVTVKIQNGSKEKFDADLVQVDMKTGEDGNAAEKVYDSGGTVEVGIGFSGTIAPGRSATAKFGFSVPAADVSLINVEVTPDWDHEASIFEGKL